MPRQTYQKNPIKVRFDADFQPKMRRSLLVLEDKQKLDSFIARFDSIPLDFKLHILSDGIDYEYLASLKDREPNYIHVFLNRYTWDDIGSRGHDRLKQSVLARKNERTQNTERQVRIAKERSQSPLTPFVFFHRIGDNIREHQIRSCLISIYGDDTFEFEEKFIRPALAMLNKKPYQKYVNTSAGRARKLMNGQQAMSDLFALFIMAPHQHFFTSDAPEVVTKHEPTLRIIAEAMTQAMIKDREWYI